MSASTIVTKHIKIIVGSIAFFLTVGLVSAYLYFLPPPQVLGESLAIGEVQKIDVNTPLRISFSRWMDQKSVEAALHITPAREGDIRWEGKTLVFTPAENNWGSAVDYQVWIDTTAQDILRKKLPESFYQRFAISGPPRVVMNLPQSIVSEERAPITVVFDRAMIPATTLAVSSNFVVPLSISPEVNGTYKWLGTNTIQFVPERLLPATTYTVKVDPSFQDIYGLSLKEEFSWQFDTAHPDILYTYPAQNYEKAGPNTEVVIRFNQAVDQNSLEQNIDWESAEDKQKVSFALRTEEDGTKVILTPQQPLPHKTQFLTTVRKGLKSKEGAFSLERDFVLSFATAGLPVVETSVPLEGEKEALRHGVMINFSNPMSGENIDTFIKIEPRIENQLNDLGENLERQVLNISGDFLPSTQYTVSLSKEWRDEYGQKMPYDFVLKFQTAAVIPDLAFVGRKNFGLIDGYSSQYQQILQAINVAKIQIALEKIEVNQVWNLLTTGKVNLTSNQSTWDIVSPNPLNEVVEIPVDLSQKVQASGLYVMKAKGGDNNSLDIHQAFIISRSALAFKAYPTGGLVWATDLKSGLPVRGMDITILKGANNIVVKGVTDSDGLFSFVWPDGFTMAENNYYNLPMVLVIGEKDGDMSITGNDYSWNRGIEPWNYHISQSYAPEKIRAFLTTDRPLYQPGQEVFFKGIYRADKDVEYQLLDSGTKVAVSITNPQGEKMWEKDLQTDAHSTISNIFTLPTAAPVGRYSIATLIGDQSFFADFLVEEYQKPLFKVDITTNKDEYVRDEDIKVTTQAGYYFGAPLANAKLRYRVYSSDYFFDRNQGRYSFSDATGDCFYCDPSGSQGNLWTEKTMVTDERGGATFIVPAVFTNEKESQFLTIEVGVEDANTRQMIYATKNIIVHKGDFYIGIANQNYVVKQRENAVFLLQSVTNTGKTRANAKGEVLLYKRDFKTVKKRGVDGFFYHDTEVTDTLVRTLSFATNNEGKGQVLFMIPEGGQYHVVARTSDAKGHAISAATDIWSSSESYINWGRDNNDVMEIIPDKDEYKIGDTAKLLLKSPYEGVKALMTIERGGVIEKKIIDIPTTATVIELPLKNEYLPNVFVSIVAVKGYGKDNVPGFKLGYINLRLDNAARKLNVALKADKTSYVPGDLVSITMNVKDAAGNAVKGDFGVAVVDEGLLALSGQRVDDLLERFFGQRSLAVMTYESLVNLIQRVDVRKGGGAKGGDGNDALALRKNFKDTAYFNPHIESDTDGNATIKFTLPDNITTWQVWVFGATDTTLVGSAILPIVSKKHTFVEPILPRFLTKGDVSHLGAVVHNTSDEAVRGSITLTSDVLEIRNATQNLHIPPQGKSVVYWDANAKNDGTTAVLNFALTAMDRSDSVEKTIPVLPWVSKEANAFGGVVGDTAAIEQLVIPVGTLVDSVEGTLHITSDLSDTTRSFHRGITENLYESADVLSAKLLALTIPHGELSLGDREKQSRDILQKIYTYAQNDGGFNYFPGGMTSDPFLSASIAFTFHQLESHKITVDAWRLSRLNEYLTEYYNLTPTTLSAEQMAQFTGEGRKDAEDSMRTVLNNKAYIAYVLTSNGDKNISTQNLYDRWQELPLLGQGYFALALQNLGRTEQAKTVINNIQSRVIKSANMAHFEDYAPLMRSQSNLHTNAVLLDMFLRSAPTSTTQLVSELVRYIVVAREGLGYGDPYADSAYIWAIHNWSTKYPQTAINTWSVTLNNKEIAQGSQSADVVLSPDLLKGDSVSNTLVIQKSLDAPLYYWGTLQYTRRGEDAQPMVQGLGIYREYYDLNDTEEKKTLDTFYTGQDIRVKLTVIVPNDQYMAIIEDNLPAGITAQNFVFNTSSPWQERLMQDINSLRLDETVLGSQLRPLFWNYQEIRDSKVITYAQHLPKGVYTISYLAKAGVAGVYKNRPARILLQHAPDVFGTTAVSTVTVE